MAMLRFLPVSAAASVITIPQDLIGVANLDYGLGSSQPDRSIFIIVPTCGSGCCKAGRRPTTAVLPLRLSTVTP